MKVKIFSATTASGLEEQMNAFFNNIIDVDKIEYSTSVTSTPRGSIHTNYSALVTYA